MAHLLRLLALALLAGTLAGLVVGDLEANPGLLDLEPPVAMEAE